MTQAAALVVPSSRRQPVGLLPSKVYVCPSWRSAWQRGAGSAGIVGGIPPAVLCAGALLNNAPIVFRGAVPDDVRPIYTVNTFCPQVASLFKTLNSSGVGQ